MTRLHSGENQCDQCASYNVTVESRCVACMRVLCAGCSANHDCVGLTRALHARGYRATVRPRTPEPEPIRVEGGPGDPPRS